MHVSKVVGEFNKCIKLGGSPLNRYLGVYFENEDIKSIDLCGYEDETFLINISCNKDVKELKVPQNKIEFAIATPHYLSTRIIPSNENLTNKVKDLLISFNECYELPDVIKNAIKEHLNIDMITPSKIPSHADRLNLNIGTETKSKGRGY